MLSRRRLIVVALVLLAAAAALALVWFMRSDEATYAEVRRGPIEQAVETSGIFRPVETTVVRGMVNGIVETVAVRPGDRVAPGDILAVLDQAPLRRSVAEAELAVDEAELAAALARARAASGSEREIADALLAAARGESARALLADAEARLTEAILISPVAGLVLDVPLGAGAHYAAGAPAATIAGETFELTATLDQADLPVVGPGAAVRVVPDAVPSLELPGTLTEIAPRGDQDAGAARFAVIVQLERQPPPEAGIRAGMTARLIVPSIVVADALLVPAEAVETVGRRTFVRVRRDGEDETVEVSLGLRQGGWVQIAAGDLASGERVRVAS